MTADTETVIGRDFKYWAFISYSQADARVAAEYARQIERYSLPRGVCSSSAVQCPKRLFPVFRDREEFASATDIGAAIKEALTNSLALIVLCSPKSYASRWVAAEIRWFRKVRPGADIIPVLISGEPETAMPSELIAETDDDGRPTGVVHEPLAVDLRSKSQMQDARLRAIASILHIPFDALKRRDQTRRRKQRIQIAVATFCLLVLAAIGVVKIDQSQREAQVETLLSNVRANISRAPDVAVAVAAEAMSLANTAETRGAVIEALEANPRLMRDFHWKFQSVALSRNGSLMVGAVDGAQLAPGQSNLMVFDLSRPHGSVRILEGNVTSADRLFVSPDGKTLVATGVLPGRNGDKSAAEWSLTSGKVVHRWLPTTGDIEAQGFLSNKKMLVTARTWKSLLVGTLDVPSGKLDQRVESIDEPGLDVDEVAMVDGVQRFTLALEGQADATSIVEFSIHGARLSPATLCHVPGSAHEIQYSGDANSVIMSFLAMGARQGIVRCMAGSKPRKRILKAASDVEDSAFAVNFDGSRIAELTNSGRLFFRDGQTLEPTVDAAATMPVSAHPHVMFVPGDDRLMTYGEPSEYDVPTDTGKVWDAKSAQPLATSAGERLWQQCELAGAQVRVWCWYAFPTTKTLEVRTAAMHQPGAHSFKTSWTPYYTIEVAFRADGKAVAATDERDIVVFAASPYSMQRIATLPQGSKLDNDTIAQHPGLSPDGKLLVWSQDDGTLFVRELRPDAKIVKVDAAKKFMPGKDVGAEDGLTNPTFSPDGRYLAVLAFGHPIVIDLTSLSLYAPLDGPGLTAQAFAFSNDGKTLMTAWGPTITFFDMQSKRVKGDPIVVSHAHPRTGEYFVDKMVPSQDGKDLVVTLDNGTMAWVDLASHRIVTSDVAFDPITARPVEEPKNPPDARVLLSPAMMIVSRDAAPTGAFLWQLNWDDILGIACDRAALDLTPEQRRDLFGRSYYVTACERRERRTKSNT